MGISNLLQLLKPVSREINIEELKNQKCLVDTSHWIYKALAAEQKINSNPNSKFRMQNFYIQFISRRITLLLSKNITPFFVFDGKKLAMKSGEHKKRNKSRRIYVTPVVIRKVIELVTAYGLQYVIAPYEADSQIAWIYKNMDYDFVISEDSDLFLYGIDKLFTKFPFKKDKYRGIMINMNNLDTCSDPTEFIDYLKSGDSVNKLIKLGVLAGCDYLQSPKRVGLKTALKFYQEYKTEEKTLQQILQKFELHPMEEEVENPIEEYLSRYNKAKLIFKHATVYDMINEKIVHLNEIPQDLKDVTFLGPPITEELLKDLVTGGIKTVPVNVEEDLFWRFV